MRKYRLRKRIGTLTCRLMDHDWTIYSSYYGMYGEVEQAGYCARCGADTHE